MSRNHVVSVGGVLVVTALTLTALPAVVAHRAAGAAPLPAPSPALGTVSRPAGAVPAPTPPAPAPTVLTPVAPPQTASTPIVASLPPDLVAALQRDLGLTRSQAETRLRNEIRLSAVERRLRDELGGRFGGSWLVGLTAHTLMVATTSSADIPRIVSAGARPQVVRASLATLRAVKRKLDQILPAHPFTGSVRYIDVRTNKVVVLTKNTSATRDVVRSTGVDLRLVVVLFSTESPRRDASALRRRGHDHQGPVAGRARW
ncbi:S1 family peptidase [Streptosporangium sp. NPDC048865]|uniref:S1 family peptidase n=1 Tax=Streptosporangium sp. NPDC048865 TaxID=3155766 RepID=UPI003428A321